MSIVALMSAPKRGGGEFMVYTHPDFPSTFLLPARFFDEYVKKGLFEESLIKWCADTFQRADGVFLDIGAHTGTYTLVLAPHFRQTFAFEPARATFYALCGGVALSGLEKRVHCLHTALGTTDMGTEATLHHLSEDGGGNTLVVPPPGTTVLAHERVPLTSVDAHFGSARTDVAFVKIDVEGLEEQVLLGSVRTLEASGRPPILFECMCPEKLRAITAVLTQAPLGYTHIETIAVATHMFLASYHPPAAAATET